LTLSVELRGRVAAAMAVVLVCIFFTGALRAQDPSRSELSLKVDNVHKARCFSRGMLVAPSIVGSFEFYDQALTGNRKTIFAGPWKGKLADEGGGALRLSGADATSGVEYSVAFKQVAPDIVTVSLVFKAPSRGSHVAFEIIKLSPDLFKGAALRANPASRIDETVVPVQPLPFAKRFLLEGKSQVFLEGSFCNLEIKDLSGARSITVADFRNVPWDRTRSIYFGGRKPGFSPGETFSLDYSIRCLPPSRPLPGLIAGNAERTVVVDSTPQAFFSLPPKQEIKASGFFQLRAGDVIYGDSEGAAERTLAKEIRNLAALSLQVRRPDPNGTARGIVFERTLSGKTSALPAEGFDISVSENRVVIRGADDRGCLYGAYALLGRLSRNGGIWSVRCGTARDWPDLPVRGMCIELYPPGIRDVGIMKAYLDALSRARANTIILLHYPQQIASWLKNTEDGWWSKEETTEIVHYARSLHMDVWGGMQSKFKASKFPEIEIERKANIYNPLNERSYERLFTLYQQILGLYRPPVILIGHDEIQGLSLYAARSGKTSAEILANDVKRIRDWLNSKGVRTAMWGDMLLEHKRWDQEVGSANSSSPALNSGPTHLALQELPKDTLILDWHYQGRDKYDSIEYFSKNGFAVIGVSGHEGKAARAMAYSARKSEVMGVIGSDWGFLATLSAAATTLYGPLCGWSSQCLSDKEDFDAYVLAEAFRESTASVSKSARPRQIDLSKMANRATAVEGSGGALFDAGPFLDLRSLPTGPQVLGGVQFDVGSLKVGRWKNSVVAGKMSGRNGVPMETDVFRGTLEAKEIAFLQTAFIEEPRMTIRKVGSYAIQYEDGSSVSADLLENWNVTDVRSSIGLRESGWKLIRVPDELLGARPGWRGLSGGGIPLNLQVFIWRNPYPERAISAIRLSAASAPPNSQIALIALTAFQ
jgi:hypothetical protein